MKKTGLLCGLIVLISMFGAGCDQPQVENPQTDAELERLMAMIVPYVPEGEYAVPEEKRFLRQLDILINEDLAGESDEYKLAVRKLALRHALTMNRVVDSIEVRRYAMSGHTPPPPSETEFSWQMGAVINRADWDGSSNSGEATTALFRVKDGRIIHVSLGATVDACGGMFNDCCANVISYPYHDDACLKDFVDLGMAMCFPFAGSEITHVGLEYLAERKAANPVTYLCLTGTSLTPDELEPLAELEHVETFIFITKSKAMNAAIFELLPHFPNLRTLELSPGMVTKSQMENLAECRKLQKLVLTPCQPESADTFEPLNDLKELQSLTIWTQKRLYDVHSTNILITRVSFPPFAFSGKKIVLNDLPELALLSLRGFHNNTVELNQLPALVRLYVDADAMEGDILSEEPQSPGLEYLFAPGGKLTESQVEALTKHPLRTLGLHNIRPEQPDIFSSLKNAKKLERVVLRFAPGAAESYGDAVLTIDVPKLQQLQIDFQEKNDILLDLQKIDSLAWLHVKHLSRIDELPERLGSVSCENADMSYERFQIFKNGGKDITGSYRFVGLILTDIDTDDLFDGWKFIYNYTIIFDESMREALKGKTLHFENCDQLYELTLQIPEPEEINIKLSNLPRLRGCVIQPIEVTKAKNL